MRHSHTHTHTHTVAFSGPKDCLANLFKFDQGMAYGVRLIDPLMNSAFFIWKKHMFMDKGHQLGCTKIKEMYLTSLSQKKLKILHEGSPILRVWYVFKRTVEKNPPDGIHAFGEKLHVTIPKKGVKLLNFNVTYSLNNGGNETGLDFLLTWFRFHPQQTYDISPQPVAEWSWSVAPTSSRGPHLRNHLRPNEFLTWHQHS